MFRLGLLKYTAIHDGGDRAFGNFLEGSPGASTSHAWSKECSKTGNPLCYKNAIATRYRRNDRTGRKVTLFIVHS